MSKHPFSPRSHTRRFRWLFGFAGVVIILFVLVCWTPRPSTTLIRPLTVSEQPARADVAIILGAGTQKNGDPLPLQAKQRVWKGVQLLETGYVSHLIVSGGFDKKTKRIEAVFLRQEAINDGADPSVIIEENASRSTEENAVDSLHIVREEEWLLILVVTSDYHTWRACSVFRKQFSSSRCIAAPTFDAAHNSVRDKLIRFRSAVREYGAIVYYWMRGYL